MTPQSQRAFERQKLNATTTVRLSDGTRASAIILDRSENGAAVQIDQPVATNDKISIFMPEGEWRNGSIVREFSGGVAVDFDPVPHSLFNNPPPPNPNKTARRHHRVPCNVQTSFQIGDGGSLHNCVVVDMSRSGTRIQAGLIPYIGATVNIKNRKGIVRRHTLDGFSVEFTHVSDKKAAD